jgi:hypothetical protein
MKRAWHPEELAEHWSVLPEDWPLIEPKQHATRLGFTVLLKFFQYAGSFPQAPQDVPLTVVDHLAQQVGVPTDSWAQYDGDRRTIARHRAQIRQHLRYGNDSPENGPLAVGPVFIERWSPLFEEQSYPLTDTSASFIEALVCLPESSAPTFSRWPTGGRSHSC